MTGLEKLVIDISYLIMMRIFFREVVYLNDEKNEIELHKNKKDKLPFAVFVMPTNSIDNKIEDYKQIFTDIISDRINQKYK